MTKIKLTQYSKGSGCGCKIAPSVLREILMTEDFLPVHPNLIIGNETNDDAAVMDIGYDQFLISTTDFFMPVVDDAFDFGKIAAANAISDVYAMGGKPVMAIAILGWPVDKLPASEARRVIEGARFICAIAGIPLAGGHSVDAPEPLFGLSVNGLVGKESLKSNNGARENDVIFITKPIGAGIISAAAKRGLASSEDILTNISYMIQLNRFGEALGRIKGVNALTDVTGFGLLGHLMEMCEGSKTSAEICSDDIPLMPGLNKYLDQFIYPDMTMKNFSSYSSKCNELDARKLFVMCDPQTSGGLLVSVSPAAIPEYLEAAQQFGLTGIADKPIGKMVQQKEKVIYVA